MSPAIGNDVVDLTDPDIAGHHLSERYLARVCTAEERARVRTARDLWSLFAAKEAAYKALVKVGEAPGFGHRAIYVGAGLDRIRWRGWQLDLAVTGDGDHVHALAWTEGPRPVARVVRGVDDPSEGARAVLRELVATALGCSAGELSIVRDEIPGAWDGYGPPRVERAGTPVDADVSLSHDGAFVAAAASIREITARR